MNAKITGFDHYWKLVLRRMPQLLMLSFAVALVVFIFVRQVGPTHQVHFSYLISLSERDEVEEYRFDGFYALQATDLFAATLAKWMQTPEVVVAAYEEAGLELESRDPRQLTKQVQAIKTAPQLIEVTVRNESQDVAERLTAGLMIVMERNVDDYHDQGIPVVVFRVVATEPWSGVTELSAPVIVIATFIFVFLLALNGVLLIESIKRM